MSQLNPAVCIWLVLISDWEAPFLACANGRGTCSKVPEPRTSGCDAVCERNSILGDYVVRICLDFLSGVVLRGNGGDFRIPKRSRRFCGARG